MDKGEEKKKKRRRKREKKKEEDSHVWNLSMVLYRKVWNLLSSVWKSIDFCTLV